MRRLIFSNSASLSFWDKEAGEDGSFVMVTLSSLGCRITLREKIAHPGPGEGWSKGTRSTGRETKAGRLDCAGRRTGACRLRRRGRGRDSFATSGILCELTRPVAKESRPRWLQSPLSGGKPDVPTGGG